MTARVSQRGKLVERREMRRIKAQHVDIGGLRRVVFAARRELARAFDQCRDGGFIAHGRIAKTRAGNPVPSLISGQVTDTSAPVAGS